MFLEIFNLYHYVLTTVFTTIYCFHHKIFRNNRILPNLSHSEWHVLEMVVVSVLVKKKTWTGLSIRQTETVVIDASAGGEWMFDFIEIMRFIYQFFRKLQVQFWKTFHSMVLCSVDCDCLKDFWTKKRYLLELPRLKSFMCIILIQLLGTRRNH